MADMGCPLRLVLAERPGPRALGCDHLLPSCAQARGVHARGAPLKEERGGTWGERTAPRTMVIWANKHDDPVAHCLGESHGQKGEERQGQEEQKEEGEGQEAAT